MKGSGIAVLLIWFLSVSLIFGAAYCLASAVITLLSKDCVWWKVVGLLIISLVLTICFCYLTEYIAHYLFTNLKDQDG